MHSELNRESSSKFKGCSIKYLFCKELETLIFTNTFVGFSKHRIKWLTSSSVVAGGICRDCKCSYIHLRIKEGKFGLISLPQPGNILTKHSNLIRGEKRSYPDIGSVFFPSFAGYKHACLLQVKCSLPY